MPGGKIRGWRVGALKHDLAGGKSQAQCAAMYGVTQQGISEFAIKYRDEIQAIVEGTRTLLGDLWIADKQKRVAAYMEGAERVDAALHAELEGDEPRGRQPGAVGLSELLRTQQAAYRAVAEELGDLPQRIKIEGGGEPVKHVIEGVNLEDLS